MKAAVTTVGQPGVDAVVVSARTHRPRHLRRELDDDEPADPGDRPPRSSATWAGTCSCAAFGATPPSLCDWGEAAAAVFADGPDSSAPRAFTARFDLDFKEVSLQAKVKKGVLVVANFNRFSDDSGRAPFFSREFFYRAAGARSPGDDRAGARRPSSRR